MPKSKYKKNEKGYYYIDRRIDGKRYHITGKTVAEVDRKLKAKLSEQEDVKSCPKFEAVAAAWWDDPKIRQGSINAYRSSYMRALDEFSGIRMDEISTADIVDFLGRMGEAGYSFSSIERQRGLLSLIFARWATSPIWKGGANVAKDAELPKVARPKPRTPPLGEELEAIKSHPEGFGWVVWLLMYTGLRLSEANGVQVKDISFSDRHFSGSLGSIHIYKAYPWSNNKPRLEKTKTGNERYVPILSPIEPILREHIKGLKDTDFILSGKSEPMEMHEFYAAWNRYAASIGCSHDAKQLYKGRNSRIVQKANFTPHQLRHELATLCVEAGVDVLVAADILGHANITTTQAVYQHVRERSRQKAVTALETLITKDLP